MTDTPTASEIEYLADSLIVDRAIKFCRCGTQVPCSMHLLVSPRIPQHTIAKRCYEMAAERIDGPEADISDAPKFADAVIEHGSYGLSLLA